MKTTIPKKLVVLFGLLEVLFVYLLFASFFTRFDIVLPLKGLDPLYIAAGLAICNTVIALQLWSKHETKP